MGFVFNSVMTWLAAGALLWVGSYGRRPLLLRRSDA